MSNDAPPSHAQPLTLISYGTAGMHDSVCPHSHSINYELEWYDEYNDLWQPYSWLTFKQNTREQALEAASKMGKNYRAIKVVTCREAIYD